MERCRFCFHPLLTKSGETNSKTVRIPPVGASPVPGLTQEGCALSVRSPHQPLSEGRVAEHPSFVSPLNEEAGEGLHPLLKVLPALLALDVASIDGLKYLLVRHGVQGREGHV